MKYLSIIISIVILFVSCSEDAGYDRGTNVVRGTWSNYYQDTDSLVMTRVFTYDFYSYFSYADGKSQEEMNKQRYSVEGNSLVMDRYTQTFRLVADTLWITNSQQNQTIKYIRDGAFDWIH
ncbi:hypothetical protein LJC00_01245 [Dysgonomonas sp. OttesenSCG-928-M03]|nr:hypothetical protein [Dysgonomonas sp. OttesenSCG-928-M03]